MCCRPVALSLKPLAELPGGHGVGRQGRHRQHPVGCRGEVVRRVDHGSGRQGRHPGPTGQPALHLQLIRSCGNIKTGGAVPKISVPHFP